MSDGTDPAALSVLCKRLCEQYPKRASSLERMFAICSLAAEQGRTDFSMAAVAELCSVARFPGDSVGPVVGTIRNVGGEPFRLLIRSFAEMTAPLRQRHSRSAKVHRISTLEQALRSADLHVQIHLARLEDELERARADLRQARQRTAPLLLVNEVPDEKARERRLMLTRQELQALRASIAPASLAVQQMKADEDGRILDDSGITIQRAGFRTAIEKVLELATSH